MPYVHCPQCREWTERERWALPPGETFPFRIVCPECGYEDSVSKLDYRLFKPDDEGG